MNKKLLSVLAAFGILISCSYQQEAYTPHPEAEAVKEQLKDRRLGQEAEKQPGIKKARKPVPGPVSAYYSDWDAAVRVDVDLQNMYQATPSKIDKPIDMYMAMALALKYNYTRRLASYQQSLLEAGTVPYGKFPEILTQAGYLNAPNSEHLNSDLKVAWNVLDMSSIYYQVNDKKYQANVSFEESRKVIHNILQETRNLYWKTLAAQRLIPILDEMIENLTLQVDEINSQAKQYAAEGKSLSTEELISKRKYMDAIKKASELKREMEDSETKLASFMGFHPSTQYHLVGSEYGNFAIPDIKGNLSDLEWLALTNRPELKVYDIGININNLKIQVKDLADPGINKYKKDPNYYNKLWSKKAREVSMSVFEDNTKQVNQTDFIALRRQRITAIVLSQVYVAWAQYMSAVEDYEINMEIANTSENIAEDVTIQNGSFAEKSKLEAARAIDDETKAFLAYADVQDALGNLYASLGLDALPYYMLSEKPSSIALYLRDVMEKWRDGEFLPDNRPYLLAVPTKRPPVNMTSPDLVPDIEVQAGERFNVTLPHAVFDRLNLKGRITTKAGLVDDSALPKWITYDEDSYTVSGVGMPSDVGEYNVKIYVADETGNVGYITFKIKVNEYYVPSMNVRGAGKNSKAEVLKRCAGPDCSDAYMYESKTELEPF